MISGAQIRTSFIEYFKEQNHRHILSASLVPQDDPSLLFTNSGMSQFKDIFLGSTKPAQKRAVTVQKVVRAGGKHNDLENVGYTARHHTFFEMLGNFSFGDYFKDQAIDFAWDLLTSKFKIAESKLAVSVYHEDSAAYDYWHKKIGLKHSSIAKLGEVDNFWSMGDTGPCGPCSEIYYQVKPTSKTPAESIAADDGCFLEIWNLVFMQFEKQPGQALKPLPSPSIDTGCGLERIASALQGVESNFDTDLFVPIINSITTAADLGKVLSKDDEIAVKVIADHIRATAFLIADGVMPSNESRGYVLRRIIRRALRYGNKINLERGSFSKLIDQFIPSLAGIYPELDSAKFIIPEICLREEQRYIETIKNGVGLLEQSVAKVKSRNSTVVPGLEIFKLYDTYGFPVEMAAEFLADDKLTFDQAEFEKAMKEQREQARKSSGFIEVKRESKIFETALAKKQAFIGYDVLENSTSALAIAQDEKIADAVNLKAPFQIVLEQTPFYAPSGGQLADFGVIDAGFCKLQVTDSFKTANNVIVHNCQPLNSSQDFASLQDFAHLNTKVDSRRRSGLSINHTATHLLHAALRDVLGKHVRQAGSLVEDNRLRFDFSHFRPIDEAQLIEIEDFVRQAIKSDYPIVTEELSYNEATAKGALAFFGDKYGERVRMVSINDISRELCGGTHLKSSSQLQLFRIVKEQSISAGVRRIEALAADFAYNYLRDQSQITNHLATSLAIAPEQLEGSIKLMQNKQKDLQKELDQAMVNLAQVKVNNMLSSKSTALLQWFDLPANDDLKSYSSIFRAINKDAISLIKQSLNSKNLLAVVFGQSLKMNNNAASVIKLLNTKFDGQGGGGRDFAQASFKEINKAEALEFLTQLNLD